MSTSTMTTQQPEIVEEVHLDDPALEEELFGEMDPFLEESLFGSVDESDTTSSSPKSTTDATVTSSGTQTTATTPDLNEEALDAHAAQRCFGEGAVTGMTKVSKVVKTSVQLDREEEKRLKLERRAMALKDKEAAKQGPAPATSAADAGAQKRKRGDEEDADEKQAKRELTDAAVAEMKKQAPVPAPTSVQKRKRGGDDEEKERDTKRGLTDDAAAEIGQRREHAFSEDLQKVEERRDSVTDAGVEKTPVDGAENVKDGDKQEEQHLAPPAIDRTETGVVDPLAITKDDDEMTRMLKEELAKPCFEVYADNGPEPEDARITEILQPLTEHEKYMVANAVVKYQKDGKGDLPNDRLEYAVEMALKNREVRTKKQAARAAANAPKKTSPLANDGVKAEEQEIDARPKLAPKSRKPAPRDNNTDDSLPTTTSTPGTTPTDDGDLTIDMDPSAAPPSASPAAKSPPPEKKEVDYTSLTLPELKNKCKERSLIMSGNKKDILDRLVGADADEAAGRVPKGLKAQKMKKKHVPLWMQKGKAGKRQGLRKHGGENRREGVGGKSMGG